jgi:hypothetical protein
MNSSPVEYVKKAELKGSNFGAGDGDGSISCAYTSFFVDHAEPLKALRDVKDQGVTWPSGTLPEGCEFLVLVKGGEFVNVGGKVRRKENTSDF